MCDRWFLTVYVWGKNRSRAGFLRDIIYTHAQSGQVVEIQIDKQVNDEIEYNHWFHWERKYLAIS